MTVAALVATLEALSGEHTVVLLAHGNGAAPGVQARRPTSSAPARLARTRPHPPNLRPAQAGRGAFYEAAARTFDVLPLEPNALHAEHRESVAVHCLVRRGASASGQPKARKRPRAAEAVASSPAEQVEPKAKRNGKVSKKRSTR